MYQQQEGKADQKDGDEEKPQVKIKISEVKAFAPDLCGAYSWTVRFSLSKKLSFKSFLIQEIKTNSKVEDCDGNAIPRRDPRFWEAWYFSPRSVNTLHEDTFAFEYNRKGLGQRTKGTYEVVGKLRLYKLNKLPRSFREGAVEEAGILPSTLLDPTRFGTFPKPLAEADHSISIKWDCCKKECEKFIATDTVLVSQVPDFTKKDKKNVSKK